MPDTPDLWKQLLRPVRGAVRLSPEEFVDELNRRFEADGCYRSDTRFVVVASSVTGGEEAASWRGPESMKAVVLRIVSGMGPELECTAPFYADP